MDRTKYPTGLTEKCLHFAHMYFRLCFIPSLIYLLISDEDPVLLFSNRYYVRKLTTDGNQYDLIAEGFHGASALDYDLQDGKIYLIDVSDGSIVKMNLDGSEREKIITDFVYGGEGLAVDWVGRYDCYTMVTQTMSRKSLS